MTMIERGFAKTSRGQLHYRRFGAGPALVLMQTIPFSSAIFAPLMRVLGDRFTCYAIEPMGYGQSDDRDGLWLTEDYADNLEEALDDLGLASFGLVAGHYCAMIALLIAQRRPRQVTGLIIDGVSGWSNEEAAQMRLQRMGPPPTWTEDGAEMARMWTGGLALMKKLDPDLVLTPDNQRTIVEALFAHIHILMGPQPYDATYLFDVRAALEACPVRTLLLSSQTDTQKRFHAENLARLPDATEHVFPGVNPLYRLDRPDLAPQYAQVVADFFTGDAAP